MEQGIQIQPYDLVIAGCGLTGAVIARHFADRGKRVLILERRAHTCGNMYDYVDENGVRVHKYGPHVFHTNQKELADFMEQYGTWTDFRITCRVYMKEKYTPSPFNFQTIDDYYSAQEARNLKAEIKKVYGERTKATIVELLESENTVIKEYAQFLFAHDYSLYTAKQWGMKPEEVDPSVLKRVPVLFSYDDGYFDDTYQKLPQNGYQDFFDRLLASDGIDVRLHTDAMEHICIKNGRIYFDQKLLTVPFVYTGAVDALLQYEYGRLPYRSLRFSWDLKQKKNFQNAPLVAYPEADGYTRITEYNQFTNQKYDAARSSLAYEYPLAYGDTSCFEPYYPVLTDESRHLLEKYQKELSEIPNLYLCGRLAEFKYYNMDQALQSALWQCERISAG